MSRPAPGARHPLASLDLGAGPLADLAPRVPFWKGMRIGVQGEPCDSLYIVAEGQVLLRRRGVSGEDYALYLIGPGEVFAEGSLHPSGKWLVSAHAVTDGAAHVLPASQLGRFAQYYPQLMAHIISLLSTRLERAHQRLDIVTINSARERLLGLLKVMAAAHGQVREGSTWLPLRVTQSELGEMISLARETVARTLQELENEGAIRRQGRKGLWLCGWVPAEQAATIGQLLNNDGT
ncbi:MAG: Crp/Fnr family transcriptional regulator [Armatimonadota bacterium]